MKVLVCGGRDFRDVTKLEATLAALHDDTAISEVIHGEARGADKMAGNWAAERNVLVRPFPADWQKHGKAAGFIRNRQMLDEGQPELVVAFPGGRGTANMVKQAKAAGVPVRLVVDDASE